MKCDNLEYKMYFLIPYNISSIQAGIQALHGVVEYELLFGNDIDYLEWAHNYKTVILLDGGTSNQSGTNMYTTDTGAYGSMESHLFQLQINHIKHAKFFEPDANNMMTSIAFLCDERVFNIKNKQDGKPFYPDFSEWLINKNVFEEKDDTELPVKYPELYNEWVNFVGGNKNVFLRSFVSKSKFKLATN